MSKAIFRQGDIVFVDFNPSKGHEQKGTRPALVVSSDVFNEETGFTIICPITSTSRSFPTRVSLDSRTRIRGDILTDQLKSFDLSERQAVKKDVCPKDILDQVLELIHAFFY